MVGQIHWESGVLPDHSDLNKKRGLKPPFLLTMFKHNGINGLSGVFKRTINRPSGHDATIGTLSFA